MNINLTLNKGEEWVHYLENGKYLESRQMCCGARQTNCSQNNSEQPITWQKPKSIWPGVCGWLGKWVAFSSITIMGQKEVLSDFECSIVVGGRQAGLNISNNCCFDSGTVMFWLTVNGPRKKQKKSYWKYPVRFGCMEDDLMFGFRCQNWQTGWRPQSQTKQKNKTTLGSNKGGCETWKMNKGDLSQWAFSIADDWVEQAEFNSKTMSVLKS